MDYRVLSGQKPKKETNMADNESAKTGGKGSKVTSSKGSRSSRARSKASSKRGEGSTKTNGSIKSKGKTHTDQSKRDSSVDSRADDFKEYEGDGVFDENQGKEEREGDSESIRRLQGNITAPLPHDLHVESVFVELADAHKQQKLAAEERRLCAERKLQLLLDRQKIQADLDTASTLEWEAKVLEQEAELQRQQVLLDRRQRELDIQLRMKAQQQQVAAMAQTQTLLSTGEKPAALGKPPQGEVHGMLEVENLMTNTGENPINNDAPVGTWVEYGATTNPHQIDPISGLTVEQLKQRAEQLVAQKTQAREQDKLLNKQRAQQLAAQRGAARKAGRHSRGETPNITMEQLHQPPPDWYFPHHRLGTSEEVRPHPRQHPTQGGRRDQEETGSRCTGPICGRDHR